MGALQENEETRIDPRYPEYVALDVAGRFASLFREGDTNFDLADMVTTTEGDNFRVNVEVMLRGNPPQEVIARAEEMLDIAKKSVMYDTLFVNGVLGRIHFDTKVSLRDADLIAAGRI